jgi:methionyl-tRNA formyltransferase
MNKFAYFGTPYVARDTLSLLVDAGYQPEVVITSPDAPRGRGQQLAPCETKVWALGHGIPVLSPVVLDDAFRAELATYGCDYGITVAYGKIIPQAVLDQFPLGMLNVHYSLLPKYRGASPVETALWNGDEVTGVSIQRMVFKLDAGNILAQKMMAIETEDTTLTLRPRLIQEGAELLIQTLPGFLDGRITPVPQDEALATHTPKIKKEQGQLSLSGDPLLNWRTYRALRESPGTYFFAQKDGQKMRVKIVDAMLRGGSFDIRRIILEGKKEQDFSYLADNGWMPL